MRRRLDETTVHGRDDPLRPGLDQAPGRLDDAQVIVNAKAKTMSRSARKRREVALARRQHDRAWRVEARGPYPLGVAVQAADALQEHVGGAEVRDEEIGVEVERDLQGLCAGYNE